ncbi:hypothetical protein MYCTH_2306155 [Thermothelomyces thermophilus ATCC 42464]|uniref:Mid2 domain-containing protein n=1 Tax=Thermothelomyces thermophilus (strain ATCC 42464 / BCRC 31852 / DSM 1799) TaxID=573729 RepID=G2QH08_THET4|nr:uncharacterized protein MYCTH_2306155 [Thermothelomyces thermophilus ATCC 42464]AEO58668.1 hypothetical protein MYCTH_2306155 [Thermothelomyces thermophilus ATCC 42464]
MAADTLSPYCVNESRTSVISTSATTTTATTATTTTTTTTTTTSSSSLASTTRPSSSRTSSNSVTTSATPVSSSESLPSTDGQTAAPSNTLSTSTSAHHPSSTSTPTATAGPHNKGGLPLSAQIAVGVVIPVAVILLVGALWFFAFRRPNRAHNGPGHRRWGTGGTASSGFATGSRGPTPPPTYDKSGLDVVVVEPPSSLYEQQQQQYATAPDAEHGRERAAVGEEFELADLRGPAGGLGNGGVSDGARSRAGGTREVSPLSDASSGGPRGQMPPHPGDVVVV